MTPNPTQKPRLRDRFLDACRVKGFSKRTVRTYWHWIRQYIFFHKLQHPSSLDEYDVESFLSHLALERRVSIATQNIAFNSLRFLYVVVLEARFENVQAVRSKKQARIPEVFTHDEAIKVINNLKGPYQIAAQLMYGAGLRQVTTALLAEMVYTVRRIRCSY